MSQGAVLTRHTGIRGPKSRLTSPGCSSKRSNTSRGVSPNHGRSARAANRTPDRAMTASRHTASSRWGSRQVERSRNMSSPKRKYRATSGCRRRNSSIVSAEYDGPGRLSSRSSTSNPGHPITASLVISSRWCAGARSALLCGGSAAGTKITRSNPTSSRTRAATRRWQTWMGLKVPPNTPIFFGRAAVVDRRADTPTSGAGRNRTRRISSRSVLPTPWPHGREGESSRFRFRHRARIDSRRADAWRR